MNALTRRWCLLALAGAPVMLGIGAQSLVVRVDNDYLRVNIPNLQFLTGKPLERLQNGNTVGFLGQLSVAVGAQANVQVRSAAHFLFSYAIWEERFKVTLLTPGFTARLSANNLTAQAAQSWCLENLKIDLSQVPVDRPIWVRLEIRAEEPKDTESVIGEPGISLSRLLELLSRPPKSPSSHWVFEAGPITLAELRKHALVHKEGALTAQICTNPHNDPGGL
jgi:hypothetical protein